MNILLFGESCTGKSTIASVLEKDHNMVVYTGKDYLRLSKNRLEAKVMFSDLLSNSSNSIIFVATEKEEIELVPDSVLRILLKADLDVKKERFSIRFRGNLPKPVELMIERKHGMFDSYDYDEAFDNNDDTKDIILKISKLIA